MDVRAGRRLWRCVMQDRVSDAGARPASQPLSDQAAFASFGSASSPTKDHVVRSTISGEVRIGASWNVAPW